MQNCELYDAATNSNVKIEMNQKIKQLKMVYTPEVYPGVGSKVSVFITHIDSPARYALIISQVISV